MKQAKKKVGRPAKPWTEEQLAAIRNLDLSHKDVATATGRSYAAVKKKRHDLGIAGAQRSDIEHYSDEETQWIRDNSHLSIVEMARRLGRTVYSVANKRGRMDASFIGNLNLYTEDDVRYLEMNYMTMSHAQLAREMGRSIASVSSKLSELGLVRKKGSDYWRRDEIAFLAANMDMPLEELARMLNKTKDKVSYKKAHIKTAQAKKNTKDFLGEIDRNVPLPFRSEAIERYINVLAIMEEGDSLEFPDSDTHLVSEARSVNSGFIFTTRKTGEYTRRIWRIG